MYIYGIIHNIYDSGDTIYCGEVTHGELEKHVPVLAAFGCDGYFIRVVSLARRINIPDR
jgi:hypothetical protein